MDPEPGRPSPLSGLWVFVVGGSAFAVTFAILQAKYHWLRYYGPDGDKACPNYGGNGNASLLGGDGTGLLLVLLAFLWVLLVGAEQLLPSSWRGRHPAVFAARALAAVLLSGAFLCWVPVGLAAACH